MEALVGLVLAASAVGFAVGWCFEGTTGMGRILSAAYTVTSDAGPCKLAFFRAGQDGRSGEEF
jgi:hypothetical protein